MFHIPNDIRAKKSDSLIIDGLEKCLEKTNMIVTNIVETWAAK